MCALKRGSVVAVPTDTLYGFACDASNAEAIENLYAVKGREKTKPVAVCVSRAEEVKKICELDGKIEESLLRKLLPGAVTLLFKRKWTETTLSKSLNPNVDNVGVRVPDCAFILDVCDAFDGAIALTSANTSGKPSCVDVNEFRELHEKCERVFDGGKIIEDDGSTSLEANCVPLNQIPVWQEAIRALMINIRTRDAVEIENARNSLKSAQNVLKEHERSLWSTQGDANEILFEDHILHLEYLCAH